MTYREDEVQVWIERCFLIPEITFTLVQLCLFYVTLISVQLAFLRKNVFCSLFLPFFCVTMSPNHTQLIACASTLVCGISQDIHTLVLIHFLVAVPLSCYVCTHLPCSATQITHVIGMFTKGHTLQIAVFQHD